MADNEGYKSMKMVARRLLPERWIETLKTCQNSISLKFASVCAGSNVLAAIYYVIANRGFDQEHRSVLRARLRYHETRFRVDNTSALLRRNVHRLEKGLIMKPRREVFGESFIAETVACYAAAASTSLFCTAELKWAKDVLAEYFDTVSHTKVVAGASSRFTEVNMGAAAEQRLITPSLINKRSFTPYLHSALNDVSISPDTLTQLFIRRRSVRWYKDREVPLELVERAARMASLAPSACNRQPYSFLFTNRKEKAVKIAKCAMGTTGFAHNIPAMVVVTGDLSAYPHERDRHVIYIDASLAAMQLMLALETLGLSSCAINWPDLKENERRLRSVVPLPEHERVVMLVAVGYADGGGGVPYSQKKDYVLSCID